MKIKLLNNVRNWKAGQSVEVNDKFGNMCIANGDAVLDGVSEPVKADIKKKKLKLKLKKDTQSQ